MEIDLSPLGALIFDLDGVIADSGEAHYVAWADLCAKFGIDLGREEFDARIFGRRNMDIFPDLLGPDQSAAVLERLSEDKEEIFRARIPDHVHPVPGVVEFIRDAWSSGLAIGVGSSAPRRNVEATLAHFGLTDCVAVSVCGEDVLVGKPRPDVFLRVAAELGRDIGRSIVFEDAPAGVRAGVAAGAEVIGVETTQPGAVLLEAGAVRVISDFRGVAARRMLEGSGE